MHQEGCFEDGNSLMARSNGRALVPVEGGCRVFLSYLTITHLVEKASIGQIKLTLIYIEPSEEAARYPRSRHGRLHKRAQEGRSGRNGSVSPKKRRRRKPNGTNGACSRPIAGHKEASRLGWDLIALPKSSRVAS